MNEFKFSCPRCGQHILCDTQWNGREINCPACQQTLVVPSLGPPVPETTVPAGPRIAQKPSGQRVKYYRYEDVPWYRRSTLNHIFAIAGLLCLPLLMWWVVVMCLTGDIYKKKRDKDGSLKTWGMFSKVFSVFLVVAQIGAIIGLRSLTRSAVEIARAPVASRAQSFMCENNLKLIGLAFRTWALDHDDQFPFNVSTKAGGSKEHCALGSDGFDQNAALHFKVLSKELLDSKFLVCPADSAKQPAIDFSTLEALNVSYQLRSGSNISDGKPDEILAVCPIHKHALRCDGSVQRGTAGGSQP
jgi:hypothetical protein